MRPITRIKRPIDCLRQRSSPSSYTCLACRHRAAFTTSLPRKAKIPWTDKLRKKIWGTDKPPGLEEPYGEPKLFPNKKKEISDEETEQPVEYEETKRPSYDLSQPGPIVKDEDTAGDVSTWEDLERVGGRKSAWKNKWNFKGFIPASKATNDFQKTVALHRAVVEVYTMWQAGKALHIPAEPLSKDKLRKDITTEVQFVETRAGGQLRYTEEQTQEKILQSLMPKTKPERDSKTTKRPETDSEQSVATDRSSTDSLDPDSVFNADGTEIKAALIEPEEDVAAERSNVDSLEDVGEQGDEHIKLNKEEYYKGLIASWDPTWLHVSLENPKIKFAVLKRTLQLTGVRIPDSEIANIIDVKSLLARLVTPPKPRKLAQALEQRGALQGLPNVSFSPKKITLIDKETSIGRWKVIEKELSRRDLPVPG